MIRVAARVGNVHVGHKEKLAVPRQQHVGRLCSRCGSASDLGTCPGTLVDGEGRDHLIAGRRHPDDSRPRDRVLAARTAIKNPQRSDREGQRPARLHAHSCLNLRFRSCRTPASCPLVTRHWLSAPGRIRPTAANHCAFATCFRTSKRKLENLDSERLTPIVYQEWAEKSKPGLVQRRRNRRCLGPSFPRSVSLQGKPDLN